MKCIKVLTYNDENKKLFSLITSHCHAFEYFLDKNNTPTFKNSGIFCYRLDKFDKYMYSYPKHFNTKIFLAEGKNEIKIDQHKFLPAIYNTFYESPENIERFWSGQSFIPSPYQPTDAVVVFKSIRLLQEIQTWEELEKIQKESN